MPSTIIGNPVLSGPQPIVTGWPWSGNIRPQGGVMLRLDKTSSGTVFIGYSGGMTVTSGGMLLSGTSGLLDGLPLYPGDVLWVPRIATGNSGSLSIYAVAEAACSGQARLYYEMY